MPENTNEEELGPTGSICHDLPSPYIPDKETGLLHLPRFIAKIRKHLKGELPGSYQRNFCRGFDRFLCMHLGIDPEQVVEAVRDSGQDEQLLQEKLRAIFPADCKCFKWNRELVQKGMSEMGQETLDKAKRAMSIEDRRDILSFADIIEIDEGRIQ